MTIAEALTKFSDVEIELLLAHILRQSKEFLYMNSKKKLSSLQTKRLTFLLKKRRSNVPMAYILGYKYFYSVPFKVNKHTLIPRPETEWLVTKSIELLQKSKNRTVHVLDVGTGSGCIAISIALGLQNEKSVSCKISALDISESALRIAKKNARLHKVKIKFLQSDLFAKIKGTFTIIIANLPYVPESRLKKLPPSLHYEPYSALSDFSDTWEIYKRFFNECKKFLEPGGTVLLEIDEKSKNRLRKYSTEFLPDFNAQFYKDLRGMWRYLVLTKK